MSVELHDILLFVLGLAFLIGGAWVLISGGTRVAAVLGVPSVVVGLTVVAFGTSAPELFVSILGAVRGSTGLVLGNVVGSNVANLGLILAIAAIIRPVIVERGLARVEVPFMLVASGLLVVLVWDGALSRPDSVLLVAGFAFFMWWTWRNRDRGALVPEVPPIEIDPGRRGRELLKGSGLVVVGIVGLAGGGQLIVDSAVRMAAGFGVSETVIGLTMVAIGTSLPELATTIVAAVRDEDDLALGNIVGSNIFNILAVAGPVGAFWGLRVEGDQTATALPVLGLTATPNQVQLASMLLVTLLVFMMIIMGRGRIARLRGFVLLATYILIMLVWTTS